MSQKTYFFTCPHCSTKQEFTDPNIQGKKVACSSCEGKIQLSEAVQSYVKGVPSVSVKSSSSKVPTVMITLLVAAVIGGYAYINDSCGFKTGLTKCFPQLQPTSEETVVGKRNEPETVVAPVDEVKEEPVAVVEQVIAEPAAAEPVVVDAAETPEVALHAGDSGVSKSEYSAGMPIDYTALGIDEKKAAKGFDYLADPTKSPRDKRDGFMIVTTEELKEKLKNLPAYVYSKSEKSGFRVYMSTEMDWDGKSEAGKVAAERKAFPGRVRAYDILDYLKKNYKKLGLKYVIFIGDARPDHGTTPMLRVVHHQRSRNYIKEIEGEQSKDLAHVREHLVNEDGHYTEYGNVISDYPFVDLDTDWGAKGDGFLDPTEDKSSSTRAPEVYVGRLLHYGEDSKYAKAEDIDIVLNRIIRYDNEKDISWRYNLMYEFNSDPELQQQLEDKGFNYELISRFKSHSVGLPAITSRKGQKHIPNFEQIQNYSIGMLNRHSHGGAHGMEGLRSKEIASKAHDRYPTVMTLGACSIGTIKFEDNLVYTLLRFQSVAVSGGTGSVTGYGGNSKKVAAQKMHKKQQLLQGKSFGEAHWEWYGKLYEDRGVVPMTAAKINIYGDPSVVPFRYGDTPPYPFLAKPVIGKFDVARNLDDLKNIDAHEITLSSNAKSSVAIRVKSNQEWLTLSKTSFNLRPGTRAKLIAKIDTRKASKLGYGVHEANIEIASQGYSCRRRFVLKMPKGDVRGIYPFEGKVRNVVGAHAGGHGSGLTLPKSVTKYDPKKSEAPKPKPFIEGRDGLVSDNKYPIGGYVEPFEKEDFTIAAWIKVDEEVPTSGRGAGKQTLLSASSFFDLYRDKTGLNLDLTTYAEFGEESDTFNLDSRVDLELGKWHHVAFSLDQTKGNLALYLDGKKVGSKSVSKKRIYATTFMGFGQFKGASDDLMIFSYVLPSEEFAGTVRGDYAYHPSPVDGGTGQSPNRIELSAAVGGALRKGRIELKNLKTRKTSIIEQNKQGQWVAEALREGQEYEWKIVGDKSSSEVWRFFTGSELLKNGTFDKGTTGWSGDLAYNEKAKGLRVIKEAEALTRAKFEKNTVYRLQGLVRGKGSVELIARSGSKEQSVASASISGPKYRFAPFEIALPSAGGDFIGEYMRIKLTNTTDGAFEVSKLSLVSAAAGDMNFPPVVSSELAELDAEARVGVDGFQVVLTDYVSDPENGLLNFTILEGPSWAYIQGDDTLFSNYGPPSEDVGQHEFKILVEDDKGNAVNITVPVTVRR